MKVARLSALCTGCPYPHKTSLVLISVRGHTVSRRIMSMEKSIDTMGNRTCDLPACSAGSQPTAIPRVPYAVGVLFIIVIMVVFHIIIIIIIVYRICHIKGCKFGLPNRLLEPNLFKGD
jgi:hypothetical protein